MKRRARARPAELGARPLVGLADAIRAAHALGSDEEERGRIARLLGLVIDDPARAKAPRAEAPRAAPERDPELDPRLPDSVPPPPDDDAPDDAASDAGGEDGPFEIVLTEQGGASSFRLDGVKSLDAPGKEPAGPFASGLPVASLLQPAGARNVLAALVATLVREGAVDVPALVAKTARGRPIAAIPRRASWTLRRGLQVLVDRSESMVPFRDDQEQAVALLASLVGASRVSVLRFERTPVDVFRRGRHEKKPYEHPPAGTPVLVMSDLGLRRPADAEAWLSFARHLRRAGCPLAALVPYPPSRWPAELVGRILAVQWDPATTVGAVRRAAMRTRGSA